MITQKLTLPIGFDKDGVTHREIVLRPQKVRDSIEALEDERAAQNPSYLGLVMQAKQILSFGTLPSAELNAELLLEFYDDDLKALMEAAKQLQERLKTFRDADAQSAAIASRPA